MRHVQLSFDTDADDFTLRSLIELCVEYSRHGAVSITVTSDETTNKVSSAPITPPPNKGKGKRSDYKALHVQQRREFIVRNHAGRVDVEASLAKLGLTTEELQSQVWPMGSAQNAVKLAIATNKARGNDNG